MRFHNSTLNCNNILKIGSPTKLSLDVPDFRQMELHIFIWHQKYHNNKISFLIFTYKSHTLFRWKNKIFKKLFSLLKRIMYVRMYVCSYRKNSWNQKPEFKLLISNIFYKILVKSIKKIILNFKTSFLFTWVQRTQSWVLWCQSVWWQICDH